MEEQNWLKRTDLALEAKEMFVEENPEKKHELDGIIIHEFEQENVKLTRVEIDQEGSERVGKNPGEYITLESQELRKPNQTFDKKMAVLLANELKRLIKIHQITNESTCLIVGLGNGYVTPDALGPNAINQLYVTTHLFKLHPEVVQEGYRPVSAFTPSVMGLTGLETSDVIFGVVKEINPDFVIVIDALAARSIDRVNATIQLSDTGIHPGSGVGNDRKEISESTIGVPVFSIGIPTVVDAVTITTDTLDYLLKHFGKQMDQQDQARTVLAPSGMTFGEKPEYDEEDLPDEDSRKAYMGMVGNLSIEEKRKLISEVLQPMGHNLMVTPKEVDEVVNRLSRVIASGINQGLHPKINQDNSADFLK
ncbi:GPR endopeptidase [Halalkalibacillus halophilus]|uniref:GPR endopeptidase n=1 Tax=Halalkalibacillus halophilus TaxID=392827 RepID=UPI0003FAFBAF|nr:GPR endopeptidase [Halalkalibacillus halophilus]